MQSFPEIAFRKANDEDAEFLYGLYAEKRDDEIACFGWSQSETLSFLKMQFDLRRKAYEMRYPHAEYRVIQLSEGPVGEMIVYRTRNLLTLVDITVSGEVRGRGIGTEAIRRLQNEALEAHSGVVLHVDSTNPRAQRLYQRLGFVGTGEPDQVSIEMRWARAIQAE
ncbi:MAG: GNAT family N-acetyltransferase [Pyrinomonadaceae bacterium]